jgi:hypothetical protein
MPDVKNSIPSLANLTVREVLEGNRADEWFVRVRLDVGYLDVDHDDWSFEISLTKSRLEFDEIRGSIDDDSCFGQLHRDEPNTTNSYLNHSTSKSNKSAVEINRNPTLSTSMQGGESTSFQHEYSGILQNVIYVGAGAWEFHEALGGRMLGTYLGASVLCAIRTKEGEEPRAWLTLSARLTDVDIRQLSGKKLTRNQSAALKILVDRSLGKDGNRVILSQGGI